MKRLTYFCLIVMFVTANALLFVGCGCDDDDDDGKNNDHDDAGAATGGSGGGGGATNKDTGVDETKDGGGAGSGGQTDEDAAVSEEDAAADTGTEPPVYACGGDEAECDLLDPEDCKEGEGCQFLAPASGNGAPFAQCVDDGDGKVGDTCDDDSLCSAGNYCNEGVCLKYCCSVGSSDECPTDQACIIDVLDQNDESTGVLLCDECDECNPLTADGCGNSQGCYPIPSDDTDIGCRLCLASVGQKDAGDPCDAANDCKPGIGCYSINDEDPVCTSFCDLEADTDSCAPDGKCTGDLIGLASMNDTVGLCVPNE